MSASEKNIAAKIALLFERTREAIEADLKNEVTRVQFSDVPLGDKVGDILDAVFLRLGIDFTDAEKLTTFRDSLDNCINNITEISNDIKDIDKISNVDESFFNKLIPAINTLISTINNITEMESKSICNDLANSLEGFDGKDLIRRIVDYILMTLFKNAREVFAHEIRLIELKAQLFGDSVEGFIDKVKDSVDNAEDVIADAYNKVESTIDDFRKEAESEIACIVDSLGNKALEIEAAIEGETPDNNVYAKTARVFAITYSILDFLGIITQKQIEIKLPEKFIETLNSAKDKIDNVVSAVDNFSNLSTLINVSGANTSTTALQLASAELIKGNDLSNFSYPIEITILDWSKTKSLFTQPIKHFKELYPIESFEDGKKLAAKFVNLLHLINPDIPDFSSLVSYLQSLIKKLKDKLIKEFKESKLGELITEVINKIQEVLNIIKALGKELLKEIKEGEIIQDLKAAINAIGSELSFVCKSFFNQLNVVTDQTKDLLAEANNSLSDLRKESEKTLEAYNNDIKEILGGISITTPSLKNFDLGVDIIQPALINFIGLNLESEGESLKKSFEGCCSNIVNDSKEEISEWATGVGSSIQTLVSPNVWKDRLDSVLEQLKQEAENDMNSITSLISPEGAKQLITNFNSTKDSLANFNSTKDSLANKLDINSYINIFKTAVDDVIIPNPELYYTSFKNIIEKDIVDIIGRELVKLKGDIKSAGDSVKNKLDDRFELIIQIFEGEVSAEQKSNLLKELITHLWKQLKMRLINPIIQEIKSALIKIVRGVVRVALNKIFLALEKRNKYLKEIFNLAKEEIEDIKEGYNVTIEIARALGVYLSSDRELKDTIDLIKNIYNGIPEDAKDALKDILPPIPDNCVTRYCKEMDCECDLNNLFVNVTLFDLNKLLDNKGEDNENVDNEKSDYEGDIKIQLLMNVGEYVIQEEDKQAGVDMITTSGLFCFLTLNTKVDVDVPIGTDHRLELKIIAEVGDSGNTDVKTQALGFCLAKTKDGYFHEYLNSNKLSSLFSLLFKRTTPYKLSTNYVDINVSDYPQLFYIGYNLPKDSIPEDFKDKLNKNEENSNGFQVGYIGAFDGLEFILKLKDKGLFKGIIQDDISLMIDTHLGYDLKDGLKIGGGTCLHLDLDLANKKLGNLTLNRMGLDLGSHQTKFGTIILNFRNTFQVDFGAVNFALEDLSLGLNVEVFKPDFTLGNLDFGFDFNFPSTIGITVNAPGVEGGGVISVDSKKGEFLGYIELKVIEKFGVSAYVICNTGLKEGQMFSLAAMVSTFFSPGIPLGMGFSLSAVGGCLGLNRTIHKESLIESVRQGTLATAFFVEDLESNLSLIRNTTESLFPTKKNQFYLGFLGRINYEPVLKCDLGLIMQLPNPLEIIIIGALKVSAGKKSEDLICINIYFSGGINFNEGLWFDASIVNSKIVGIELEGDMAFRLFWGGACKGFLLSIGGFHPAYKPEEGMMVTGMKRLSMGLDYSILSIKFETYLAITSNTFQIGASLDLKVGWESFGLTGHAQFDALFQFDPFLFMFALSTKVGVVCGSWNLFAINLNLNIQGPQPWHVIGNAGFEFIGIPIDVDFDIKWGDDTPELPSAEEEVIVLLENELNNKLNWSTKELSFGEDVEIRKDTESNLILVQPFSSITFNQSIIPWVTKEDSVTLAKMEICNNARIMDVCSVDVSGIYMGEGEGEGEGEEESRVLFKKTDSCMAMDKNHFAPALYQLMSIEDKINSKSYEQYNSGFTITPKVFDPESDDLNFDINHCYNQSDEEHYAENGTRATTFARKDKSSIRKYIRKLDALTQKNK